LLSLLTLPMAIGLGCTYRNRWPVAVCRIEGKAKRLPDPGSPFAADVNIGGRPVGAGCAFDTQCLSKRCSADVRAGTCGECLTVRALGETCTGPHEGCSATAVCQDGVCKSLNRTEGEICSIGGKGSRSIACDSELACIYTRGYNEPATCTRTSRLGECCDVNTRCARGLTCNGETNVCEVASLVTPDTCMFNSWCYGENYCGEDKRCHPGTLPENAACDSGLGKHVDNACSQGLICQRLNPETEKPLAQPKCVPLPKKGEPCIRGRCEPGLYCAHSLVTGKDTTCELPHGEGESCFRYVARDDEMCAAGLECRVGKCRRACK